MTARSIATLLVGLGSAGLLMAEPGLIGIVFDSPSVRKPVRIWTVAEPRAELFGPIARHDYSLVLQGTLTVPFDGPSELRVVADDGVRVRIDDHRTTETSNREDWSRDAVVQIQQAGEHRLALEYFQDGGFSRLELAWRPTGATDWRPVPASAFRHSSADRAAVEERFAALMREHEQVVATATNPQPRRWPTLRFVQQGSRPLLRADFPDVSGFTCDAWMYESEMDLVDVRDAGQGRLEVRHRLHADPGIMVVSLVTPEPGAIEVVARAVRSDGSPAVLPPDLPPPDLCWQLRHARGFRAFPEPYERFASRCFVFTEAGFTTLDRTRRLPTERFPSDDPVNNPPWVQVYLPQWVAPGVRLPFAWAGVSPDRLTATVAGVVSRDGRHLAAIANDSATSISQVWVDCLHNDAEWEPGDGSILPPTWRIKIYLMRNDPAELLRRVRADFPKTATQSAFVQLPAR